MVSWGGRCGSNESIGRGGGKKGVEGGNKIIMRPAEVKIKLTMVNTVQKGLFLESMSWRSPQWLATESTVAITKTLGETEVRKGSQPNHNEARRGENRTHVGKYSPTETFFGSYDPAEESIDG